MRETTNFDILPRNITELMAYNDFCIGCGICAGICPSQVLNMQFNKLGQYQPIEIKPGCLTKCDLCLRCCPFWNQKGNEDTLARTAFSDQPEIKHNNDTGYYLECFVGYSNIDGHRVNGASGGLTTWFLETLIKQQIVDHIICVISNPNPEKLFKFAVLSSTEEIRSASRSAYYPVELSEVIQYVLHHEGQYAITGLPCFIKGLRLAMRNNKRLRERLVLFIGLVCGQSQSKYLAEYLCMERGGDPQKLSKISFRVKDPRRPANDFGYEFNCSGGKVTHAISFWKKDIGIIWGRKYFTPRACLFCDDTFAETADVVFLDAWLEDNIRDPNGTNIVLVRNKQINDLFHEGMEEGNISITEIQIDKVIKTQHGAIYDKHKVLSERLGYSEIVNKNYVPQKRVSSLRIGKIKIIHYWLENLLTTTSKQMFRMAKRINNLFLFKIAIFVVMKFIALFTRLEKYVTLINKNEND